MKREEIFRWLRETDPRRLQTLYERADAVRRAFVGDAVHLRGLVEISNRCERQCHYCGLRAANLDVKHYRMSEDEILDCARLAVALGYGTLVMQAGEDPGIGGEWMEGVIRRIKRETPLAVTLSLGERTEEELARWREVGADRYLLRFETSDFKLYRRIHPPAPGRAANRIELLGTLKRLGYEAGSGVMVGIPGQTYGSLAEDIETFRLLDLDMIGIGPWIPHPATPLGSKNVPRADAGEQAPNTEEMVYKMVALTRLACPEANIPSTSALATINKRDGRELGLQRGANIVMPNLTPLMYRRLYEIYPSKACIDEDAESCARCLTGRITSIGRTVGSGAGGRERRT